MARHVTQRSSRFFYDVVQSDERAAAFGSIRGTRRWGSRLEAPEVLARRWITLIERLSVLDPALRKWSHWEPKKGVVPFDPSFEAQLARVVAGMETKVTGEVVPACGSSLYNTTYPCPKSHHVSVTMYAGISVPFSSNLVIFETPQNVSPAPELATYNVFRGATLAVAETFEPTQVFVYPDGLSELWGPWPGRKDLEIPLAWISYVAPRFAHLVMPPPRAIVERRPDGGLLMAATDDTFRTDNPEHLAVARDIEAALAPFNALPWTAETGK